MKTRVPTLRRTVASLAVAAGIIVAMLVLGAEVAGVPKPAPGPHAPPATASAAAPAEGGGAAAVPRPPLLPTYPGAEEFPLGEELTVNGVPVWLSSLVTGDAPTTVRDHYARAFAAAGLEVRVTADGPGAWTVSALTPDAREQLLILVASRGAGRTWVLSSRLRFGEADAAGERRTELERAPSPTAVGLTRVGSPEAGGPQVVTWHEPQLEPGAAAVRVRDAFGRAGWDLAAWSPGATVRAEFTRGAARARLTASPDRPAGAGAVVVVAEAEAEVGGGRD